MPKLRQNPITGEWVVIAPERAKRPQDFIEEDKKEDKDKDCPFCENGAARKEIIDGAGEEGIYVIPNKFPSFITADNRIINEDGNLYFSMPSRGACEVIILEMHQDKLFATDLKILKNLFLTYQKRIKYYENNPLIAAGQIFHNSGDKAGASISHPHSQLFFSSTVPSYIERELKGAKNYWAKEADCIYCQIIKEEQRKNIRIVESNDKFLAFTFFASRFPFEIWILPKAHQADYTFLEKEDMGALADIFQKVSQRLAKSLHSPSYNFWLHTLPYRHPLGLHYYHWHLEMAPRLTVWGGYEFGSGVVVDIVSPEKAAEFLREVKI